MNDEEVIELRQKSQCTALNHSKDYYNSVSAPMKDFALIDGCGHSPHYDAPTEFCNALKWMLDKFLK